MPVALSAHYPVDPVDFTDRGWFQAHLDGRRGVAVRVGQHCAEPLMQRLGLDGTVRASFGLYNTHADVEALAEGVAKAKVMLG